MRVGNRRRWLATLAFLFLSCAGSRAQEAHEAGKSAESGHSKEAEEEGKLEIWKWANFLLLAAAFGYVIGKNAGPFFDARSQKIRKDMVEAEDARKGAEARAAEVDRKLARLGDDIAALKGQGQAEAEADAKRMAARTAAELAKIQAHAEQEIASAGKAARVDLKRYSAQLAVSLAEQKIRARMTPETQDALVRGFVKGLEDGSARAQTR
jgi:F-type H+-transporting ATPase subunit b